MKNEGVSHSVVMANINGVPQPKDGISHSLQVSFPISEVCGGFLKPFTEPFGALSGLPVCVCGHQEHTDYLARALEKNYVRALRNF